MNVIQDLGAMKAKENGKFDPLSNFQIYCAYSERKLMELPAGSVSLSLWSPPYFVGKEYEKGVSYQAWQDMLREVIKAHFYILKPGGFLVINIADILCFKDPKMPRIQANNVSKRRCAVTSEMVLEAQRQHPSFTRYQLAELLGCSEQTVDRRLHGNNIRGGKHEIQTRVKLVGGALEQYGLSAGLFLYDHRIWHKDPAWANSRWTSNTYKAVSEYEDLYVFWKPGEYAVNKSKLTDAEWKDWGLRGVWEIASVRKNDDHEAKFPLELAEKIIRLYSEQGDTVIDPFVGSGTSGIAALKLGRPFIGIDKEPQYAALSIKNITDYFSQGWLFS